MFKHIALASKCSESSVQYQKPGLDHLEHWKALTLAQHQLDCTIQEQLENEAAYRRTTNISRATQNEARATVKNLLQSLKLKFSSLPLTIRRTP